MGKLVSIKTGNEVNWNPVETTTQGADRDILTEVTLKVNAERGGAAGRVKNTLTGAAKGSAAGYVNAGGTAMESLGKFNTNIRNYQNSGAIKAARDNIARYQEQLKTTTDQKERARLETLIERNRRTIGLTERTTAIEEQQSGDVARRAYQTADALAESSARDIATAKAGLNGAGKFAVDVGVAGTQLAGDILAGLLTGGSAMPAMAVRTFGSGAQEARQSGASFGAQLAYGAGSAALGAATEKIANVAAPFKNAFGAGVVEKLAPNLTSRLTGSAVGKTALSAISEGGEEFVEALFQPVLQRATYDKDAAFNLEDALYDAAVGAVLGGAGGVGDAAVSSRRNGAVANAAKTSGAEARTTEKAGVDTDAQNGPAEAPQSAKKAAPETGTAGYRADYDPLEAAAIQHTGKTFKNLVAGVDTSITNFFAKWRYGRKSHRGEILEKLYIGKVTGEAKAKLSELLGYEVKSGHYIITADNVKHIMDRHGNDAKEIQRGNLPLSTISMDDLADVVAHPDRIKLGDSEDWEAGRQAVEFEKDLGNGTVVYVQFDNFSRGTIEPRTLYIRKGTPTSAVNPASAGSTYTSETTEPEAPVATIPHSAAENKTENDGVGAADAGFATEPTDGEVKTSRMADRNPYNSQQEAATGMTKEEYDRLFRYESQTEKTSLRLAEEMLFFDVGGKRTFLKDYSDAAFQNLVKSLDYATAWNGPQTDAAHIIQTELQYRSANLEIESEEYVNWIRIMREHETSTGQGVQAHAKWSRNDNHGGSATEADALENLEKSNLSDDEKAEVFRNIVACDVQIGATNDAATLKDIIMKVAEERGVVNGPMGAVFRKAARKALDVLTIEQLKQFAYSSTSALSTDYIPANAGQKLKTIQILNMLSSPKTAARNILGNTTFYGIDALAMDGAAVLDMALAHVTGTRSVAMERAALGKSSMKDAAKAIQMAIAEITLDVDMNSAESRYGTGSNRTFKARGSGVLNTGIAVDRFVERTLSAIERNQAYLLTATDEFYKGAARGTEAATQKLVDAGKIKTKDSAYAEKQGEQLAKYRTFQDDSKLSVAIQQIHDVLNLVGIGDSGKAIKGKTVHSFGAGDFVAPFTRVAANIVSRGVEYTPVNAVKGVLEIVGQVVKTAGGRSADPTAQAKAVSDTARGLTGTAIAYGFMVLAKEGLLRQADDEDDEDVAALNQSEGISGTQINISAVQRVLDGGSAEWKNGDTLVDLASVEPLNLLMNLGTEMAKESQNPLLSSFKATADSTMDASTELPMLQTVGNIVTDVVKYNNDPKEVLAREAASTLISSVVPNALSGVAKGMDDRPRNTYTGDDLWDIIQDTFKSKVPGLRETLPGSVNTMGEEKLYEGSEDSFLSALLNPLGVNTYTQSEVSKEMERVREATGETGFYPTKKIPSELSDADTGRHMKLTYAQRQNFQRDRGATTLIVTADLMGTAAYKQAKSSKQAELLNDAYSYAYQVAKANVLGKDTVDKWVKNTMAAQKSVGLNPATVILYRDMLSEEKQKDQTAADANKAVRAAIMNDDGMSVKQKDALDNIVLSDGIYIPKDLEVDYSNTETFAISQMSDGAQKRWSGIESQFGMDAETYGQAWAIYQNDDLTAAQKRQQLSALGYNGTALYKAFGKKLS